MKIGGKWVGWGLDDTDPQIVVFKERLRRKFSYAADLDTSPRFDEEMLVVVFAAQSVYHDQGRLHAANGIIDFDTQVALGWIQRAAPRLPTLFTVQGTGVDMWFGPPADTARAVADRYVWQPIGNYPATAFPMAPSVAQGRAELNHQIDLHPGPVALAGYSQGAIVTAECWEFDIKPAAGRLHHRINDCVKAVAWGNPMREIGKAHPDPGGVMAGPGSHGIADQLMVDTPPWWRNYAHKGDLYTDCEGESGENKTAIYKVVLGARVFSGPDSLLSQVLEVLGVRRDAGRLLEVVAMFRAIIDAGMFFAARTGPHINYDVRPAVDYLRG